MPDPLPVQPFRRPLQGILPLPGSKSITNRALVLAALAEGNTRLEGVLFSRDTRIMLDSLRRLGFGIDCDESSASVSLSGQAGNIPAPAASLHVGNAGTSARFLTAMLALRQAGSYRLNCDAAMEKRPMAGLIRALEQLDAARFEFHGEPDRLPFTIHTKGYRKGRAEVDARASSQILSALLLAAPAGEGAIEIVCPEVRPAYVAITGKVREAFGAAPLGPDEKGAYILPPVRYRPPAGGVYTIEPDLSAASYFLALTLLHGGRLNLPRIGGQPLQGDASFAEALAHHGLRVDSTGSGWDVHGPENGPVKGDHREINFEPFSDTFLTYAAIAPLLGGSVRITGIGHTRHQETDRIAGMATQLARLGQLVQEEEDALTIQPKPNELRNRAYHAYHTGRPIEIETYEDHRFAMSFAILGTCDLLNNGQPWLAIKNPGCCNKTFPDFFERLADPRLTEKPTTKD
ncbi:MAG: 3-phosphoshikimate 1-carboxyvinyltransferase [Opitutales bacterium]